MNVFLKYPVRAVDGLFDRLFAIAGALVVSQVPGYVTHYVQRLSGHVAEAARNVRSWQEIAQKTTEGSMDALMKLYLNSDAPSTVEAGRKCAADMVRLEDLRSALQAIRAAPVFKRSWVFLRHMDVGIARDTCADYVPNLPLDAESIVYALIGVVLAVGLYQGVKQGTCAAGRRLGARRRRQRQAETPTPA